MSPLEQEAKTAADQFRRDHHLGVQPLGDLVELIQRTTGHDVAVLDVPLTDHGLTMHDPVRNKTFIGVARTEHPMRQRSTLAHELAHVVFRDQASDLSERSNEEIRADAFARHLLIPQEGVIAFLGGKMCTDLNTFSSVVQRFLVSPYMAAIMLRDVGAISGETFEDWKRYSTRELAVRFGWRDHYAGLQNESNQLRAPQRLVARAIAGYAAGVLSAQAVATLCGATEEETTQLLNNIGIYPQQFDWEEHELKVLPEVEIDLSDLDVEDHVL